MKSLVLEETDVYDFNIPGQGIESVRYFVFPYETVQLEESNPVVGKRTLNDALSVMLHGTNLRGDLAEGGIITISQNINLGRWK